MLYLFLFFQLHVNDELVWDNGTAFPEPCIDRIADTVGKVTIHLFMSSISDYLTYEFEDI
jgi:hypothetical protein